MDPPIIEAVAAVVTTAVILISAVVALWQLVVVRRTQQADLWTRIFDRWSTREMGVALWKVRDLEFTDYEDFVEKYPPGSDEWNCRREVMNYFEFVGGLTQRNYLNRRLVLTYFKELPGLYKKFEKFITAYRKRFSNPGYMSGFEWLYKRWKKKSYKQGWGPDAELAWGHQPSVLQGEQPAQSSRPKRKRSKN